MNASIQSNAAGNAELSVVIVVLTGGDSLRRCLEALQAQIQVQPPEVIVPHDDVTFAADELRGRFPGVRFLPVPGGDTYAKLRAAGVRAARGHVVAITEDQCIPPNEWCANILAAHQAPHAAIGGPIEKHTPDTLLGWAIYLREFTSYIPPVAEGPSGSLTDCNVTYKRAALDTIRSVWAEAFHEPDVHAALLARSETLWLHPGLVTYQQRTMPLGEALRERYDFGRLYGSLRVASVPAWKRMLLAVVSPLLPLLLTARVGLTVVKKGRYVGACLFALPYLVLFATAWSCGEFVGYVTARPSGVD